MLIIKVYKLQEQHTMNWFTQIIQVFRTPTADVLAVQELEDARRQLLSALSAKEYASALVTYHSDRVVRLTETVKSGATK